MRPSLSKPPTSVKVSWNAHPISDQYHGPVDLLRHLEFFVAVAEERHFGQAAARLGMTQPPLSQGLKRLEQRFGVRLFERDARGVRITDAGKALLPPAMDLVDAAQEFVAEAAAWSTEPALRIGIAADVEDLAAAVVTAVARPGLTIQPHVGGSVDLVDRLKDADLDLALVRHPGVVDGTVPRSVISVPTVVVGSHGPADIAACELPVVVPPRRWQPPAHDQLVDGLRRRGHSGAVIEEADPIMRRALVAAGRAVAIAVDPSRSSRPDDTSPPMWVRVLLPVGGRQAGVPDADAADAVEGLLR